MAAVGGLGAVFSAISAIGSMFFAPSPPSPPPMPSFTPPPTAPSVEDPSIQAEAEKEKALRGRRASGLNQTILTSGSGVEEEALVKKTTLLGE